MIKAKKIALVLLAVMGVAGCTSLATDAAAVPFPDMWCIYNEFGVGIHEESC